MSDISAKTSAENGTDSKKPQRDHTTLRAWQVGRDLAITIATALQEYQQDPVLKDWCYDILYSLREAMVQITEGFYKYHADEKLRRYDAARFYLHRVEYTLTMGQDIGWWQLESLIKEVNDFSTLVHRTASHFFPKKGEETADGEDKKERLAGNRPPKSHRD